MKTSELVGKALDWAVAKCEGVDEFDFENQYARAGYRFSTDWAQGGPILEREAIEISYDSLLECCVANLGFCGFEELIGPTPLVAAMRCFVSSKLGEEVEIPRGLL